KDFGCFQQVYHHRSVRAEVTERTETFLSHYFKDRAFSSACHHLQQLSPLFQVMLFESWRGFCLAHLRFYSESQAGVIGQQDAVLSKTPELVWYCRVWVS
ncbi:hypothetical protein IRJ41_014705, partial [Triplophysa rosa]